MPLHRVRTFLDHPNIQYVVISHSLAYTAQGVAALTHIPGKELAKTVIEKVDGNLAMATVPVPCHVDLRLLKAELGASTVSLRRRGNSKPASRLRNRAHASLR